MPFRQIDIEKEIEKQSQNDPELRKVWDETREEYRLIGEMISLRKKQKITQSQLAEITGNKQQVISRMEKHESVPSLKLFCNMLNALGYTMEIKKKVN